MKTVRRALSVGFVAAFIIIWFQQGTALAIVSSCTSSPTAVAGGTISVSGSTNMDQAVRFVLDRGTPQAVTLGTLPSTGAPGVSQFNGTLTIPSNVATNTNHLLTATNADDTSPFPCGTIFVLAAAPTATPTAAPTATPDTDDDDDDDFDAGDLADLIDALDGDGGGGQQQQQQQQAVPVVLPAGGSGGGGGSKLPKTGADAAEVGGIGTLSLLAGVSLMEFARRRRRHWLTPAARAVAPAPRPGSNEGDLLLPYLADRP